MSLIIFMISLTSGSLKRGFKQIFSVLTNKLI